MKILSLLAISTILISQQIFAQSYHPFPNTPIPTPNYGRNVSIQDVQLDLRNAFRSVNQNIFQLNQAELNQLDQLLLRVREVANRVGNNPAPWPGHGGGGGGGFPPPVINPYPVQSNSQYYLNMSDAELLVTAISGIGSCKVLDKRGTSAYYDYYLQVNAKSLPFIPQLSDNGGTDNAATVTLGLRKVLKDGLCTNEVVQITQISNVSALTLALNGIGKCLVTDKRNTNAYYHYYVTINNIGIQFDNRLSDNGGTSSEDIAGSVIKTLVQNGSCY